MCFEKVVPRLQRSICIPEPLIDRALAAGGECELCPPPPTPRPTRGPVQSLPPANVCPGDRNQCSEDNPEYVWFCFCTGCRGAQKQCSTLCIKKEDAAPLLLDPCNSCGRCETFTNCDLFPCGNNDEKVQICHYAIGNGNQPGGYETLCISKSALVGHLDPPPPHCDHCGACLPSPPDPATCTKT